MIRDTLYVQTIQYFPEEDSFYQVADGPFRTSMQG